MSHIQTLSDLKKVCDTTGKCTEYYAQLQHEDAMIDARAAQANQAAINWGIIFAVIGVLVLLTPFVKSVRKLQKFSLPTLAFLAPILIGLVIGFFVGVLISFGACFKQDCSAVASSATLWGPAVSLLLSVPIATKIYNRKQNMEAGISNPRKIVWVTMGIAIIALAVLRTAASINSTNASTQQQKDYYRTVSH